MRTHVRTLALAGLAFAWSCSGSGPGAGSPAGPSQPGAPAADPPITINIIGERGAQSFSPNPAMVPDGRTVIWRNTDVVVHRVLLNDRSVDTGDILPGASSAPMPLGGVAKPYHCSLHPTTMVGSLNNAPTEVPPPTSPPPTTPPPGCPEGEDPLYC